MQRRRRQSLIAACVCAVETMASSGVFGVGFPGGVLAQGGSSTNSVRSRTVAAPAPDQRAIATTTPQSAVAEGQRLLEAGNLKEAVARLTAAIATGHLAAHDLARALYLRGKAYHLQSQSALAIADLGSALYLKNGLEPAERAEATELRTAAYGVAGVSRPGPVGATADAAAPATGDFFAGLFGSKPSVKPATAAGFVPQRPQSAPSGPQPSVAAVPAVGAAPPAAIATASIATARIAKAGQFRSRVALVRTQAEADAVVARLEGGYVKALAGHAPDIGRADFGNMGSFFEVRVGPFVTVAEAQTVCARLRGGGFDCVAVDR